VATFLCRFRGKEATLQRKRVHFHTTWPLMKLQGSLVGIALSSRNLDVLMNWGKKRWRKSCQSKLAEDDAWKFSARTAVTAPKIRAESCWTSNPNKYKHRLPVAECSRRLSPPSTTRLLSTRPLSSSDLQDSLCVKMDQDLIKLVNKLQDTFNNLGA